MNDDSNSANINKLLKTIENKEYIFVGLAFDAPVGATKVKIGETTIDLTVDGESVVNGKYINYFAIASKSDTTWTLLDSKAFTESTIEWLDESNEVIAEEVMKISRAKNN